MAHISDDAFSAPQIFAHHLSFYVEHIPINQRAAVRNTGFYGVRLLNTVLLTR